MLAFSFVLTKVNSGSRHGDQYSSTDDLILTFLSEEDGKHARVLCEYV